LENSRRKLLKYVMKYPFKKLKVTSRHFQAIVQDQIIVTILCLP